MAALRSLGLIVQAIAIAQAAANLASAMHRLRRFADDFFDSHYFALRFAVGSQCPKFDSQTAMRYRVNYSLRLVSKYDKPRHRFCRVAAVHVTYYDDSGACMLQCLFASSIFLFSQYSF